MYDPTEDCKEIIKKLKNEIQSREISYYALAKKTNISTSAMYNIMNGNTIPQVFTLLSICNELHISMWELFEKSITTDENKILSYYRAFPMEKRKQLLLYADMLNQYNTLKEE